jgi:transposase
MSMRPREISPVPEETARVARAANPKGNVYMRMRDELGSIYENQMFVALFPQRGQPAEAPWRLALVTVMQYMEGLSDRQAAEAVRERIDWKYALSLELTDPGFDFSLLCEFRTRLLAGGAETQLLQALLDLCKSRGWRNRARTPTHGFDPCAGGHTRVSIGSSARGKRCVIRSMCSQRWPRTGCWLRPRPSSLSATAIALMIIVFPRRRPNA